MVKAREQTGSRASSQRVAADGVLCARLLLCLPPISSATESTSASLTGRAGTTKVFRGGRDEQEKAEQRRQQAERGVWSDIHAAPSSCKPCAVTRSDSLVSPPLRLRQWRSRRNAKPKGEQSEQVLLVSGLSKSLHTVYMAACPSCLQHAPLCRGHDGRRYSHPRRAGGCRRARAA